MLGGDKNSESANFKRSKQNFYGPHLSDGLKIRQNFLKHDNQVTEVPTVHSNFQKFKCRRGAL